MRKQLVYFLLILGPVWVYAQDAGGKVLYIVDSIPVIEEPDEGFGMLNEKEIDRVEVVKNKEALLASGHGDLDGIIYIFTKAYAERPDSIKAIPSTKRMVKQEGTWYLQGQSKPYSGPFIDYYLNGRKQGEGILVDGRLKGKRLMYHLNGNVSDEIEYENGFADGTEKRFYEDGTLMQQGEFKEGVETGVWKMYHPNGQLKQHSTFNETGKMDGESVSYYSTGQVNRRSVFIIGSYQEDKVYSKLYNLYEQSQQLYRQANFKGAIKKLDKALEIDPTWAEAYFARGTMKLNNLQFEEAVLDFDQTLEIEPYFTNAYGNRAFARIHKHELGNSRTLSKSEDVQVLVSKSTEIPSADLDRICQDLNKGVALGDNSQMVLDALETYCGEH